MKFLERGLILLGFIGYYLAAWNNRVDVSVLFISAAGFACLYILGMPFLLSYPDKPIVRDSKYYWQDLPIILVFGIISAYCVFSMVYHTLGKMTSQEIIENCSIFLTIAAILAFWRFRKTQKPIYRNMLMRIGILAVFIVISLLLQQLHPAKASASF